ncbi:hypothetical protein FF1_001666 [Malus domestica]
MKLQVSICTLIFLSLIPPFPSSVFSDLNSDRQALLNFAATVVHIRKLNWNASTPVCMSWVGITCNLNKTSDCHPSSGDWTFRFHPFQQYREASYSSSPQPPLQLPLWKSAF